MFDMTHMHILVLSSQDNNPIGFAIGMSAIVVVMVLVFWTFAGTQNAELLSNDNHCHTKLEIHPARWRAFFQAEYRRQIWEPFRWILLALTIFQIPVHLGIRSTDFCEVFEVPVARAHTVVFVFGFILLPLFFLAPIFISLRRFRRILKSPDHVVQVSKDWIGVGRVHLLHRYQGCELTHTERHGMRCMQLSQPRKMRSRITRGMSNYHECHYVPLPQDGGEDSL